MAFIAKVKILVDEVDTGSHPVGWLLVGFLI